MFAIVVHCAIFKLKLKLIQFPRIVNVDYLLIQGGNCSRIIALQIDLSLGKEHLNSNEP